MSWAYLLGFVKEMLTAHVPHPEEVRVAGFATLAHDAPRLTSTAGSTAPTVAVLPLLAKVRQG